MSKSHTSLVENSNVFEDEHDYWSKFKEDKASQKESLIEKIDRILLTTGAKRVVSNIEQISPRRVQLHCDLGRATSREMNEIVSLQVRARRHNVTIILIDHSSAIMLTGDRYVGHKYDDGTWKLINKRGDSLVYEECYLRDGVFYTKSTHSVVSQWSSPDEVVEKVNERLVGTRVRKINTNEYC